MTQYPKLKKYNWKDWKMGFKKTPIERQVEGDLVELGWERKKKIEEIKKKHKWLP